MVIVPGARCARPPGPRLHISLGREIGTSLQGVTPERRNWAVSGYVFH